MVKKKTSFIFVNIIFVITMVSTSCGLQVMEEAIQKNVTSFSHGCLNGLKERVNLYIKGELTTQQINEVAQCVKTALLLFKDRVHGKKKGEFTPDELRKFIHGLFLQDKTMSDVLLSELMRLKTIIIGGPEDKLTESDIEKFIIFVEVLIKEAIFFQPYIQALSNPTDLEKFRNNNSFNRMEKDLKESISRISVFTEGFF